MPSAPRDPPCSRTEQHVHGAATSSDEGWRWYDCEGNELAADGLRVESARYAALLKIGKRLGIRCEPEALELTPSERHELEEINRYLAESRHPLDVAFPDFARAVRTSRYDAEAVYLESLGLDERRRLFTELAKVRNRIGRHLLLCQASKALGEAFASNRTPADRRSSMRLDVTTGTAVANCQATGYRPPMTEEERVEEARALEQAKAEVERQRQSGEHARRQQQEQREHDEALAELRACAPPFDRLRVVRCLGRLQPVVLDRLLSTVREQLTGTDGERWDAMLIDAACLMFEPQDQQERIRDLTVSSLLGHLRWLPPPDRVG